ncbi:hypothetical protein Ssi02_38540 [Sinosporangium siamense]|uniref:Uncharacterized protein n=1 Tax=Sinosporangium siamense TaxID=1367973 RepID=A0A919RHD1_9ACTN|nr:hypothetical protein Ssi02_38540 [Sinosporangium siamense]
MGAPECTAEALEAEAAPSAGAAAAVLMISVRHPVTASPIRISMLTDLAARWFTGVVRRWSCGVRWAGAGRLRGGFRPRIHASTTANHIDSARCAT